MKLKEAIERKGMKDKMAKVESEEMQIVKLIRDDPYISRKDIAKAMDLSRQTTHNRIQRLMGKGVIVSRHIYELAANLEIND
jgi:DNA-binding Lrp family transcriptional regulator